MGPVYYLMGGGLVRWEKYEDSEHETLSSIEGIHYGVALVFLKRRNPLHKKTNHLKILILRLWSRFLPRYFTNLI